MNITVNGTDIFYQRHLGGRAIVLLHGWGGSHKLFEGVFSALGRLGLDVVSLDLPGFGKSPLPPAHFSTDDYAECVRQMIQKLQLKNVTIIGHSFGGRLGILLGSDPDVEALVLTGCAGIKPRFSLKKWVAVRRYKRAKRKGKDLSRFGSADYKAAGEVMRGVLVRVTNRHLDEDVGRISVPTLLVWGKADRETPLYMARRIKKSVKDCALVVLNGGHYAYLENSRHFCEIVKSFILGRSSS